MVDIYKMTREELLSMRSGLRRQVEGVQLNYYDRLDLKKIGVSELDKVDVLRSDISWLRRVLIAYNVII